VAGSVMVSGVTPTPTITETSDGFCFTIPSLAAADGDVSVTYQSVYEDVPAGGQKCGTATVEYTSAPVDGFAVRSTSDDDCAPQLVIERIDDLVWIDSVRLACVTPALADRF
jgi:hypothetical protein